FAFLLPRPPGSTLFPYTTLFRSGVQLQAADRTLLFREPRGRRLVTATLDHLQRHVELAGLGQVGDDQLRILDLDVMPALDVSGRDRKSTRLNSSHVKISYAVFCL